MIIETKTLKWYNQLIELQELIKHDSYTAIRELF